MDNIEKHQSGRQPPIVLTTSDRERLLTLLRDTLTTRDPQTARDLHEEIARADIVSDDVASTSVVRMGCYAKFVDVDDELIQCARLVFPEEIQHSHDISVMSSIGSALIGLGSGQSIRCTEHGRERMLAVLEVGTSERRLPQAHLEQA